MIEAQVLHLRSQSTVETLLTNSKFHEFSNSVEKHQLIAYFSEKKNPFFLKITPHLDIFPNLVDCGDIFCIFFLFPTLGLNTFPISYKTCIYDEKWLSLDGRSRFWSFWHPN